MRNFNLCATVAAFDPVRRTPFGRLPTLRARFVLPLVLLEFVSALACYPGHTDFLLFDLFMASSSLVVPVATPSRQGNAKFKPLTDELLTFVSSGFA
jgi:hypothetical protein